MQQYVAKSFGTLVNPKTGREFCTPCMDDVLCSDRSLQEHIDSMRTVFDQAAKKGFEFKYKKGQMNQEEIEFWGAICNGKGRRPNPKKVQQLEQWPEPKDQAALTSFLAFANYLRE